MEKPASAFVLCFISGILILINSVLLGFLASIIPTAFPTLIGQYAPEVTQLILLSSISSYIEVVLYTLMAVGVIFSTVILLGAIIFYIRPSTTGTIGTIILILSILSICTGGGFFIGFILGIIGGSLGIAWKPKAVQASVEPGETV